MTTTPSGRASGPVRWFDPRPVPLEPGPRPPHALARAVTWAVLHGVGWGLGIGALAGATAGTLIFPVVGTAYGMLFGLVLAVPATIVGIVGAVTVLSLRHRRLVEPTAVARDLARVFAALTALLLGIGARYLPDIGRPSVWIVLWGAAVLAATTLVVVTLLRWAAADIAIRWSRSFGWRRPPNAAFGAIAIASRSAA